MNILFKYTTRSRRSNFLRGYESIVNNISSNNYHVLISVENLHHDPKMHPLPDLKGNHTYFVNPNAPTTKVDAINRNIDKLNYEWDILVNMSDDMIFTVKGFDFFIKSHMDNLDRFLFFNDGNRNDDLVTMSIIGKKYYSRDKYIYHPSYKSLWCDNEATEVAKERGCFKKCEEQIFKHLHPAYGLAHVDQQYLNTEGFNGVDRDNYFKRKSNGWN